MHRIIRCLLLAFLAYPFLSPGAAAGEVTVCEGLKVPGRKAAIEESLPEFRAWLDNVIWVGPWRGTTCGGLILDRVFYKNGVLTVYAISFIQPRDPPPTPEPPKDPPVRKTSGYGWMFLEGPAELKDGNLTFIRKYDGIDASRCRHFYYSLGANGEGRGDCGASERGSGNVELSRQELPR